MVLGHQADEVRRAPAESVDVVVQEPQLGTGTRSRSRRRACRQLGAGRVLVHLGDEALVRPASLRRLRRLANSATSRPWPCSPRDVSIRTATAASSARLTAASGDMVEEVDATPEERAIDEIWSGTMLLARRVALGQPGQAAAGPKGEYYLPDLVNMARQQGLAIHATLTEDEEEVLGVNDRAQLAHAEAVLRQRKIAELLQSGVTIVDPATTYIEPEVEIEPDRHRAGCHLRGRHAHRSRTVRSVRTAT